jgi:uncharacterized protein (TIGR03083 family)
VSNDVAYQQVRANVAQLLDGSPDIGLTVPACPEWTVQDLLAHLVHVSGIIGDRLAGTTTPAPPDGLGVDDLLAEWDTRGRTVDPLLAEVKRGTIGVMDAYTHELDIRYALGASLPVDHPIDHPAYPGAIEVLIGGLSKSVAGHGLPAVRVRTEGVDQVAGQGEPVATVSGEPLELYRSLAGRRTHEQIAALSWTADPQQWLPAFAWGPFRPPEKPAE